MTFTRRMMAFVDGENLTMRFKGMVGKMMEPSSGIKFETDTYVWHPSALVVDSVDIVRVSYYTYVIGDDERLKEVNRTIRNLTWVQDLMGIQVLREGISFQEFSRKNKSPQNAKEWISVSPLMH